MPPAPPVPGPRYQALLQLLRTAETLWNASRLFFERWDLGPSQFNLLNLLIDCPEGLSQTELSRQLITASLQHHRLGGSLEARGLLQRNPSAGDRRAYRVVLTASGKQAAGPDPAELLQGRGTGRGGIPATRVKELLAELQQLSVNAEELAPTAQNLLNSSSRSL